MKKFSKILVLVLALALIVGACFAFAACNDNDSSTGNRKINMLNVELSSEQYAFIFKKSDTELKEQVNQILADKATEVQAIIDKYLNASADELMSFGSVIKTEATGAADELVVATNAEFAPFEYFNGNKLAGIDIEIAQLIADQLGKSLVVEHMKFEAVVTSVQTIEKYDIGMAALTISPDRAESVDFSSPYYDTTQVLVLKANDQTFQYCTNAAEVAEILGTLSGNAAKCGGQRGTTGEFYVRGNDSLGFAGYSNLSFEGYDAPALAVEAMLNGNISFVIVDKAIAISLLKNFNV